MSNIIYDGLTVKGRKGYTSPSPVDKLGCSALKPSLLHFNEFDMNNNHLSVNLTYNDNSVLNFPLQFTTNQVGYTTDLLDEVVLTEVVN